MIPLPAIPLPTFFAEHDIPAASWDDDMVRQALQRGALLSAAYVKGLWVNRAQAMGLRDKGPGSYVGGIKADGNVDLLDSRDLGQSKYEVVIEIRNAVPHARYVEDGRSAFHLPSRINWSRVGGSIKQGQNGPYLHIPFGHSAYASPAARERQGYTRGAVQRMMPQDVYAEAKHLRRTVRRNVGPIFRFAQRQGGKVVGYTVQTGQAARRKALGMDGRGRGKDAQFIQADRYKWGDRLQRPERPPMIQLGGPGAPAGTEGFQERRSEKKVPGSGTNPQWASSKWQGMFRSGPRGHSQYTTIRTMTPHSQGWHIPAQVGKGIARQIGTFVQQDGRVLDLLQTGVDEIMQAATGEGNT